MNEMELLTRMRGEVPLSAPSPATESAFQEGLIQQPLPERTRRLVLRPLPRTRFAVAGGVAIAATAALLIAVLPLQHRTPAGQAARRTMSVTLLANLAAKAALSQPSVKPNQWVYRKTLLVAPSVRNTTISWVTADGLHMVRQGGTVMGIGSGTGFPLTYAQIGSLPKNPAVLDAYLSRLSYSHPTPYQARDSAFSDIRRMLISYVLPPAFEAELYQALGDIPGLIAKTRVTDVAGRPGVAFVDPQGPQNLNLEIILSAKGYRLLATASWVTGGGPASLAEQAILSQAFVSGPRVYPKASGK